MRWMLMAVAAVCLWVCVPNPAEAGSHGNTVLRPARDASGRVIRDRNGDPVFVRVQSDRKNRPRQGRGIRTRRPEVVIVNDRRPVIVRDSRFRSREIFDSRRGRSLFFGLAIRR